MKFNEYMTIREAANFLGVETHALRNWEKIGKVRSVRNPMNGYRMYIKEDLQNILDSMNAKIRD